jgi:hypothetical protein
MILKANTRRTMEFVRMSQIYFKKVSDKLDFMYVNIYKLNDIYIHETAILPKELM